MSYDPVHWNLRPDPDARVTGVYLSSYHASAIRCPVPLEFVLSLEGGPQAYQIARRRQYREDGEAVAVDRIEEAARRPLASFQGSYYGRRFRVPCTRDAALLHEVIAEHRALWNRETGRAPGPFWLVDDGRIVRHASRERSVRPTERNLRAVVHDDVEGRFYAIDDHKLFAIDRADLTRFFEDNPGVYLSFLGARFVE